MRSYVVAFFGFCLIFGYIVLAGVPTFSSQLLGTGGDTYQYLGFQSLVRQHLTEGGWPFRFTNWWRYPDGFDFSRGYDSVLSNLFGGWLSLVTNQPITAYNFTIFASFLFNALCAYMLFLFLSRSRKVGFLLAVSYGFSFYALARAGGHLNLLLIGGFPLVVFAVLRLFDKNHIHQWRDHLLLGIALSLVVLSSAQYFMLLLVGGLVAGVFGLLVYKEQLLLLFERVLQKKEAFVASIGLPALVVVIVYTPLVLAMLAGGFAWDTQHDYSPGLRNFIVPNPILETWGSSISSIGHIDRNVEHAVFLGWTELVVFAAVLGFVLVSKTNKRPLMLLLPAMLIFLVFSFGLKNPDSGIVLPYSWLIKIYPFKAISEPGRFVILVQLSLLAVIAQYWRVLFSKKSLPTWVFGIVLFGLLAERWYPHGFPRTPGLDGAFTQVVAELPGKAVLDLPLFDERHNELPLLYGKPIISGYMHWLGDTHKSREFIFYDDQLSRFICNSERQTNLDNPKVLFFEQNKNKRMFERIKNAGVATIVVHKDYKLYDLSCLSVFQFVTSGLPRLALAKESRLVEAVSQQDWSGSTMQAGLFFPKEGVVEIKTLQFYPPVARENMQMLLDGNKIAIEQWQYSAVSDLPNGASRIWVSPPVDQNRITVKAGSKLEFMSDTFVPDHGFFAIHYHYEPVGAGEVKLYREGSVEKVYEDAQKEVFQIW